MSKTRRKKKKATCKNILSRYKSLRKPDNCYWPDWIIHFIGFFFFPKFIKFVFQIHVIALGFWKMPQRHSKNNNDLAFFTYDEKRKLGYGTQKERLGKDSIKPFDACSLCLKPFIDPLCCQKGHVFCKECILECLLSQKKDIQRCLFSVLMHTLSIGLL